MISRQDWLREVKGLLDQAGVSVEKAGTEDGSINFEAKDGGALRLGPDGILTCSFTADLEEIRTMISGDTTEDLSEDELCRVAREELRPVVDRHRRRFIQAGFEEGIESDHEQYSIVFTRTLTGAAPQVVSDVLKWCRDSFGLFT